MATKEAIVKGNDFTRTVWFAPGPKDASHPLCVLLDGEHYLNNVGALSILQQSMSERQIPPMSLLFVEHKGPKARHEDYTCNDRFARFVSDDLVMWARKERRTIGQEGHIICGMSLSGLQSAYISLKYPKLFPYSLCQSGSFWWKRNHFSKQVPKHAPVQSRFWLSVGDKEIEKDVKHPPTDMHQAFTQIAGVKATAEALSGCSAEVRYNLYSGGHEFGPWKEELIHALQWLLNSPRAATPLLTAPELSPLF